MRVFVITLNYVCFFATRYVSLTQIWKTEYTRTQLPGPPEEPASPGQDGAERNGNSRGRLATRTQAPNPDESLRRFGWFFFSERKTYLRLITSILKCAAIIFLTAHLRVGERRRVQMSAYNARPIPR